MDSLDAAQIVFGLVAGIVAVALATVLLRPLWLPIWHLFRGTQQFLEDWFGEPAREKDGVQARPGAMARLAQLERNSGSSLRDAVDRIEGQIAEVQTTATQATIAAGLAVGEAKAGRAVMAQAMQSNREQIAELRGAVGGLSSTVNEQDQQALAKEVAFVRALRRLGVDLTDVTDELPLDEDGPAGD